METCCLHHLTLKPLLFEDDSFNTDYFTPPANRKPSDKQIALGKNYSLIKIIPKQFVSCASMS
jgi:cytochrome c peroxidase